MTTERKTTLLQAKISLVEKIIITALIMCSLILIVHYFNIPNPNMILIAGLVFCSALFGFGGGIVGALIMLGYSLYFFSTDHSFVSFTPENNQKVLISIIGIAADMVLVCSLKAAEMQAFKQVDELTKELSDENRKLQQISVTDTLTGIRNRQALRQDYESYRGHEVTVMMVDLNNFKQINDTRGHEEGDRILTETGKLLSEAFGPEHCYRYGGDEFLVVVPDLREAEFAAKLKELIGRSPKVGSEEVLYSTGYAHAMLDTQDRLRELIVAADERMYQDKHDSKNPKAAEVEIMEPELPADEFTVAEMKDYLNQMNGKYDLARVVDPTECRILELNEDGSVKRNQSCYGIWNSEQRCLNCSSKLACSTGSHQTKAEEFQDKLYYIQSSPVSLKLADGTKYDAVVELVSIQPDGEFSGNDREAENVGTRAARYAALHDGMTNTLNAEAFYEKCRRQIKDRPDTEWVMVTSNIMNFRLINTLFGEMKGNEVLVRTAALLKGIAERTEGICGRLGGDQFALLIPKDRYREESLRNTNKILAKAFSSGVYTFCIHFGVYETEDPDTPVSIMCGRANSALRTIREDMSRIIAYFNDEIRDRIMQEQTVISGFDEAMKEGQFRMYLQPIVSQEGVPFGAEALVRWQKPDGTMIMPVDFIETLEQAGLIHLLDVFMWESAVKQLSSWKNTEMNDLFISINMSARDFYRIDVYQVLTNLIRKYDVESRKLRLELTETALITDQGRCDAIISALRREGFIIEIDDFGTGYSSLSLLKNIHADVLKIDRTFLQEIEGNRHNSRILAGVIALAKSLGMEVISEGVETEQQLNTLSEMGCRYFQGYYFSRPIPVEEFEAKYAKG